MLTRDIVRMLGVVFEWNVPAGREYSMRVRAFHQLPQKGNCDPGSSGNGKTLGLGHQVEAIESAE